MIKQGEGKLYESKTHEQKTYEKNTHEEKHFAEQNYEGQQHNNNEDFFSHLDRYDLRKLCIVTYSPLLASLIKKKIIKKSFYLPIVKTYNNWLEDNKFFAKGYVSKFDELILIVKMLKKKYKYNYITSFAYAKKIQKILERYEDDLLESNITYEYIEFIKENKIGEYNSYRKHIKNLVAKQKNNIITVYMPDDIDATFANYGFKAYNRISTKVKIGDLDSMNAFSSVSSMDSANVVSSNSSNSFMSSMNKSVMDLPGISQHMLLNKPPNKLLKIAPHILQCQTEYDEAICVISHISSFIKSSFKICDRIDQNSIQTSISNCPIVAKKSAGATICCIIPNKKLLKIISMLCVQNDIQVYQLLKTFKETRLFHILNLSLVSFNTQHFLTLLQALKINIYNVIMKLKKSSNQYSYALFIKFLLHEFTVGDNNIKNKVDSFDDDNHNVVGHDSSSKEGDNTDNTNKVKSIAEICQKIHNDLKDLQNVRFPIKFNQLFAIHLGYIVQWPNVFNDNETEEILPASFSEIDIMVSSLQEYRDILVYLSESASVMHKQLASKIFFCSPYEAIAINPDLLILTSCSEQYWAQEASEIEHNYYQTSNLYQLLHMKIKVVATFNNNENQSNILFNFQINQWKRNDCRGDAQSSDEQEIKSRNLGSIGIIEKSMVKEKASNYQMIKNPISDIVQNKKIPKVIYATSMNLIIRDQYAFYLRYILRVRELNYGVNKYGIIGNIIHEFAHRVLVEKKYNGLEIDMPFDIKCHSTNTKSDYQNNLCAKVVKLINTAKIVESEMNHEANVEVRNNNGMNHEANVDANNKKDQKTQNNQQQKNKQNKKEEYKDSKQKHQQNENKQIRDGKISNQSIAEILTNIIMKYKYKHSWLPRIVFFVMQWMRYYMENIEYFAVKNYHTEHTYSFYYRDFIFKSKIDLIVDDHIFIDYKTTNSVTLSNIQQGNDWQLLIPYLINKKFDLRYVLLTKGETIIAKKINQTNIYKRLDEIIDSYLMSPNY